MCGIYGGIKSVNIDKIKILGVLNESRGTDSTGFFDNQKIVKACLPFNQFAVDYHKDLKNYSQYIVGHTRFATTGKVTERNAHPFCFGKITGVHNGVIRNFQELKKKHSIPKLECDSEIIFFLLNKLGIAGLKELSGYYTIVFRDNTQPEKLFVIKHNSDFSYVKQNNSIYFASDSLHLETAFTKANKIVDIDENTLYTIDINTLSISKEKVAGLEIIFQYETKKSNLDLYKGNGKQEYIYNPAYNVSGVDGLSLNDYFSCPECRGKVSIEEAESGFCPLCFIELSGNLYACNHCEGVIHSKTNKQHKFCKHCNKKSDTPDCLLTFHDYSVNTKTKGKRKSCLRNARLN